MVLNDITARRYMPPEVIIPEVRSKVMIGKNAEQKDKGRYNEKLRLPGFHKKRAGAVSPGPKAHSC